MENLKPNRVQPYLLVLMMAIVLGACKKDILVNQSSLQHRATEQFIVSSMQNGPEGDIFCIGKIKDTDSSILLRFDALLRLKETISLRKSGNLKGDLRLKYIMNEGWLIAGTTIEEDYTTLTVYKTDEEFNIINQKELIKSENVDGGFDFEIDMVYVTDLQILSNNDFLVVCDTIHWEHQNPGFSQHNGVAFYRLGSDLSLQHEAFRGDGVTSGINDTKNLNVVELQDGALFYIYRNQNSGDHHIGILEQNGSTRYSQHGSPYFPNANAVGISPLGNHVLLNSVVTNLELQYYTKIDPATGNRMEESSLDGSTSNSGLMGPNRLSLGPVDAIGHLLFNENENKLYFMSVDAGLKLQKRFDVFLPQFNEMLSYRQAFTTSGTLLVGSSYEDVGRIYFNIQELSLDGEFIR